MVNIPSILEQLHYDLSIQNIYYRKHILLGIDSLDNLLSYFFCILGSTQKDSGVTEVTAGSLLDDDQWHDVIIRRDHRKLKIVVDRLVNEVETNGLFYRLDLDKFVSVNKNGISVC